MFEYTTEQRLAVIKHAFVTEVEDILSHQDAMEKQAVNWASFGKSLISPGVRIVLGAGLGGLGTGAVTGWNPAAMLLGAAGGGGLGLGAGSLGRLVRGSSGAESTLAETAKDLLSKGKASSIDDAMVQARKLYPSLSAKALPANAPPLDVARESAKNWAAGTGTGLAGAAGLGLYGGKQVLDTAAEAAQGIVDPSGSAQGRSPYAALLKALGGGAAGYFGTQWLQNQYGLPDWLKYLGAAAGGLAPGVLSGGF